MSDSLRPHRLQPTRLLCPWDFPGKNIGVGCHCLLRLPWLLTPKSLVDHMVKNLPVMQETGVQSLGLEDPLEKEMAIHSSILAWRIPWTGEPGGLQSMGSQRVGHDWVRTCKWLTLHYYSTTPVIKLETTRELFHSHLTPPLLLALPPQWSLDDHIVPFDLL